MLTDHGKPIALSGSLENRVRKSVVEAGPVSEDGMANHLQYEHRKRRAEEITQAAGPAYEVMAPMPHSDPKASAIYTDRVEKARLAKRAIGRMEQAVKNQSEPRPENRQKAAAIPTAKTTISDKGGSP